MTWLEILKIVVVIGITILGMNGINVMGGRHHVKHDKSTGTVQVDVEVEKSSRIASQGR